MKAISLFSGIGGFDLGFEKAGITTVLQVEQDKHALAVLARHWPHVGRLTDVRDVGHSGCTRSEGQEAERDRDSASRRADVHDRRSEQARGVELIFGGFPCQDVSVAGQRAGLSGERSGLWFEFHRILAELRPRWCVIENVPGLFSSNEGRDFAVILDSLDELGYGVAWRVLDAQAFGVPQRRRRVFIVGCLGDVTAAAAVLAVREGGSGDSQESGEAREGTTGALSAGTLRAGGVNGGNNPAGGYLADVAHALRAQGNDPMREDAATYVVAQTLALRGRDGGSAAELGGEQANALRGSQGGGDKPYALIANTISASAGHHEHSSARGDGSDNLVIPFDTTQSTSGENRSNPQAGDPMHPLAAGAHVPAIAYIPEVVGALSDGAHHSGGLNGQDAYTGRIIAPAAGVRRLTPLECERLMGFPDGHTAGQSDSHRYRQLGNAVVVPVAEYIGHRLMRVDALLRGDS